MKRLFILISVLASFVVASGCAPRSATVNLSGTWRLSKRVTAGAYPGTSYVGTIIISDANGRVSGTMQLGNAKGKITGTHAGQSIRLVRVDDLPGPGFRTTFAGTVSADGETMSGTFANDPSAPFGNDSSGPWTASRIR